MNLDKFSRSSLYLAVSRQLRQFIEVIGRILHIFFLLIVQDRCAAPCGTKLFRVFAVSARTASGTD